MPFRPEFERSRDNPDRADDFGERLRRERERRNISIASIAESTKILGALFEGLERNDLSRWPANGVYRRAFVRAYASAIGLRPESVLREFLERFPDPEEGRQPAHKTFAGAAVLRLTLEDTGSWFSRGQLISRFSRRLAAIAFDASVLGVLSLGLFTALGAFWAPLSVCMLSYYFISILVLGNTPGVCLFATRGGGGSGTRWSGITRIIPRISDLNISNIPGVLKPRFPGWLKPRFPAGLKTRQYSAALPVRE